MTAYLSHVNNYILIFFFKFQLDFNSISRACKNITAYHLNCKIILLVFFFHKAIFQDKLLSFLFSKKFFAFSKYI